MSESRFEEALYMVDDSYLVHLKEEKEGCRYGVFDAETKMKLGEGVIPWEDIESSAVRSSLTAFRLQVFEEMGLDGAKIAAVSVNMLRDFFGSDVRRRSLWEPETLPKNDIRFIDSRYNELFRIPDGGYIKVEYPDRQFSVKCEHIDAYHAYIGTEVLHICQFAELLERGGGKCQPEPESGAAEMGWRLGGRRYLALQHCEAGWKYSLYDDKFRMQAGSILEKPELSINQARNEVMEEQKLESLTMTKLGYAFITEKAGERAKADHPERRESLLGKLETIKSASPVQEASVPPKKHREER